MKNLLKYLSSIAALSFLFYQLTIQFLPNIIYKVFESRAKGQGLTTNKLRYVPLPTDEARAVVMPNPDFLYTSSFYDVSENPIQITATMPDSTYWSIAFYESNTVNWYIKNDQQFGTNKLNFIVAKEATKVANTQAEVAYSPIEKGFFLVRILVTDNSPETLEKYKIWQESMKLEAFTD